MANKIWKVKNGMGGSRCGRGRSEKTAEMKKYGRKLRRRMSMKIIREQWAGLAITRIQ